MNCENAKLYYYDYLEKSEAVPPDFRGHLEQCPVCRKEMDSLREVLGQTEPLEKPYRPKYLQLHYQLVDQWISCDEVRPFLPSLLIPEFGMKYQTPVTAHVENCPECQKALRKIASLQLASSDLIKAAHYLADERRQEVEFDGTAREILNQIKHRDISDVLTRMRFKQTDDIERRWLSDSVMVDVEHRHAQHAEMVPQRRRSLRLAVPIWVTSGVAAAVLFAVLLMLPTGDAKALDAKQLYANLETVRNAHIQKFDGPKELENIWISEGLGAYLFQREKDVFFVDKRSGKFFQKHDGAVQLVSQGGKMELERPWGLLPFKHISELPASYDWEYISDTVLEDGLKVKIYEWSWKETLNNQTEIQRTWRGYLDSHNHMPYRIEWWDKIGDSPAQLIMEMKVSYPSDAECLEVFESYGFGKVTYGDQDELLRTFPSVSKAGSTEEAFFLSTWPSAKTALNFPEE